MALWKPGEHTLEESFGTREKTNMTLNVFSFYLLDSFSGCNTETKMMVIIVKLVTWGIPPTQTSN